jgi:hypothetical protein
MELLDPKKLRLLPGQGIEGMFTGGPGQEGEVGLFVRSAYGALRGNGDLGIQQRAGLVHFNDVLLVLTMIRTGTVYEEFFDVWWNYHSRTGPEHFRRMSQQERLMIHFYN